MDILQTALCEKLKVANTQLLSFHLEKLIQKVIVHYCFPHKPKSLVKWIFAPIFTARKRSCGKVMSVILFRGREVPMWPWCIGTTSPSPLDTRLPPPIADMGPTPFSLPSSPHLLLTSDSNHWKPVQLAHSRTYPQNWYWHLVMATESTISVHPHMHSVNNYRRLRFWVRKWQVQYSKPIFGGLQKR